MVTFKTYVELAANAESFIIKDVTLDWEGYVPTTAVLAIYSALNGTVYIDLDAGQLAKFLSSTGLEIGILSYVSTLTAFPDDYYVISMYLNDDGDDIYDSVNEVLIPANIDYEYDNNQGFMAYIREAARKLPLPLDVDNFNFNENRHVQYLYALLDAAEADANQAEPARFAAKMNYVSTQLNLRGIEYGT